MSGLVTVAVVLALISIGWWRRTRAADPTGGSSAGGGPAGVDPPGLRIEPAGGGMFVVHRPDGSKALVDEATVEYLRSTKGQPNQAELDELMARTRAVRVWDGGVARGAPLGTRQLLEVDDAAAIAGLRDTLRIEAEPGGHCMCHGDPAIELLGADGQRLAVLGVHHGHGIRWDRWKDDATLVDGAALLRWLAERGVDGPLAAYEEAQAQTKAARLAWNRWAEAVPACVRDIPMATQQAAFQQQDVAPMRAALDAAYPTTAAAVRALVRWFGSGTGPWTGFPSYESFAAVVLAAYDGDELRRVLTEMELDEVELEGAARFLVHSGQPPSWPARPFPDGMVEFCAPPQGPVAVPAALHARLLAHVERTGDPDKQARAGVLVVGP